MGGGRKGGGKSLANHLVRHLEWIFSPFLFIGVGQTELVKVIYDKAPSNFPHHYEMTILACLALSLLSIASSSQHVSLKQGTKKRPSTVLQDTGAIRG